MGLDVTAYAKAKFVHEDPEFACEDDDHVSVYTLPPFAERLNGLQAGHYRTGGSYHFYAGSYHAHHFFRDVLARVFYGVSSEVVFKNPDAYKDKPFFELIWFSDCEGTIGTATSKKLAEDFKKHGEAFKNGVEANNPYPNWTADFLKVYENWTKTFALATKEGFVCFS